MFNFLKDKLKSWLGKGKEEAQAAQAPEKKPKTKEKPQVKEERKKEERKAVEKITKDIEKKKDLEVERKISGKVIEDIKQERGTDEIKTMPSPEEIEEKIEEVKEEIAVQETPAETAVSEKKGFFARLKDKFSHKLELDEFEEIFSGLEEILLENNLALEVIDKIKEGMQKELVGKQVSKEKIEETIKQALKKALEALFYPTNVDILELAKQKQPLVILFFGINGSGKTTTIAKLANYLKNHKITCVLAASDTFRAASIEQIMKHADKLQVKVIHHTYGADPAAVAYDAIEYAKSKKIQVVLIDTAGRMHTKSSLIKEMEKIVRVTKPDLKLFVAESIAGNDVLEQAKIFNEAIGIDGIILSKSDVDEKGGTSLSISYVTGKPILFLGTGQNYEDLEKFEKDKIISSLGL